MSRVTTDLGDTVTTRFLAGDLVEDITIETGRHRLLGTPTAQVAEHPSLLSDRKTEEVPSEGLPDARTV